MNLIKTLNKKNPLQVLPMLNIEDLEKIITMSSESYHNDNISLIPDWIYDILIEKLKVMNPKSNIFKHTGAHVKGKKVKLPIWMGSMDKIKTEEKLIDKWTKEYIGPYIISDKLDGISCLLVLTINKSVPDIKLYTRGDGEYGQDISHLAKFVNMSIYNLLDDVEHMSKKIFGNQLIIRGELIMKLKNFEKYENIMVNARNMVGGIVNSKQSSLNKKHANDVDFIVYEAILPNLSSIEQMKIMEKMGLNVVKYDIYQSIDLTILDNILQKRKKKSMYDIDGLIVTDNKIYTRNKSGNPDYSFAYKGLTQTADVKVIEVLWKPGKDGIIVPRIHYEKVKLSKAELTYATGFHAKFIHNNKIGPGAIITIIRSGDVIPYVMQIVKPSKISGLPTEYDYTWDKNKVNIILDDADDNEIVIIQRLTKFARDIGIENLSEGYISRLVDEGYDTIQAIISLTIDDLLTVEGIQITLAKKLYNNIQQALKNLDLLLLMVSSNIFGRGFGEEKIKKILNTYPNIVNTYKVSDRDKWENKLVRIDGLNIVSAQKFLDSMRKFQKFYDNILNITEVKPYINNNDKNGIFKNQKIVFTGFRKKEWKKFIEEEGGNVSGKVSRNSTLLVYNDGEESSSNYQTAKKLGIKSIPRSVFGKMYNLN